MGGAIGTIQSKDSAQQTTIHNHFLSLSASSSSTKVLLDKVQIEQLLA